MPEQEKAPRKAAGPMDTAIVKVDGATITVLKKFETTPSDKDIKAALMELGEGDYTVMTSRSRPVAFKKAVVEKFSI